MSLAAREVLEHEPEALRICFLAATEHALRKPWHKDSYINSSTGALSLNLIHLFKFDTRPRLVQKHETTRFIYAVNENKSSSLYVTSAIRLDRVIQPGLDHVYMIEDREHNLHGKSWSQCTENRICFLYSDMTRPLLHLHPSSEFLLLSRFSSRSYAPVTIQNGKGVM